ncbi:hypothetical protein B0H13DRAFT_1910804 [Mycena leptocephala]|nr:hypothetical protein B0H13DRAFT_1910804 [Mycena leptocephala]
MLAKSLTNQTLSDSSEEDTQPFSKPVHPNLIDLNRRCYSGVATTSESDSNRFVIRARGIRLRIDSHRSDWPKVESGHAHIVDVSGHRESEVDARTILPETSACSRAPTTPQCAAEEAIEERSTKKVEKPCLHDSYDSDSGPFIYVVCIYTLRAFGGATTTIVVAGTITAGVMTDGTTMIVAEADKEAGVAGMMIGGIRYLFILLSPPVHVWWARVAGILFLSGELDIPKLQTFVAAGDRYPLAVNWTAKFATTGAPFPAFPNRARQNRATSMLWRMRESESAISVTHEHCINGLPVACGRPLVHFSLKPLVEEFIARALGWTDDAYFATGICILLLR